MSSAGHETPATPTVAKPNFATLHKSATLLLPIIKTLVVTHRWLHTAQWVGAVLAVVYAAPLKGPVASLRAGYLETEYISEGALIWLLMNALPVVIPLWKRERFAVTLPQNRLCFGFSLGQLACWHCKL